MLHPFSSMAELNAFRQFLPSSWLEDNGLIKLPPPHPSRVYKPSNSPLSLAGWSKEMKDPAFLEPKSVPSPPLSSTLGASPRSSDIFSAKKFLQFHTSPILTSPHSPTFPQHSPSPMPYLPLSLDTSLSSMEPHQNSEMSPLAVPSGGSQHLELERNSFPNESHAISMVKKKRANFSKKTKDLLLLWLEEHLDNPYPSEKDKHDLAIATSLSLNQVNNWFVNARRRHLLLNASTKRHMLSKRVSASRH